MAAIILLVGIIADRADIKVLFLGLSRFIEVAPHAMVDTPGGDVNEASLNNQELLPFGFLLTYHFLRESNADSICTKTGRVYDLTIRGWKSRSASINISCNPGTIAARPIVFVSRRETVWSRESELYSRFLAGILIGDPCVHGRLVFRICFQVCLGGAYPGSRGLDQSSLGIIRLPRSGGCIYCSSACLLLNRIVDRSHFVDLPGNNDYSQPEKQDSRIFTKTFRIIFATLFGSVGSAFCGYGVYKRREIGGSAYAIIIGGWGFLWFASLFLMSLIDPSIFGPS